MSQFTLTQEEDAIITDALRSKATQYNAMFGAIDPVLEALIAKLEGYNPENVLIEETVVSNEETPVKGKKSKEKAAEQAFLDGTPHEQYADGE